MKLELYWPSQKPYTINQPFGTDYSGPACNFNKDYPCDKTLYQYLGLKGHSGIDFQHSTGVYVIDWPLYSPIDGTIEYIENDEKLGLGVVIFTDIPYEDDSGHSYYWKIRLWHLARNSIVVKIGQRVRIGDYLGMADNTGLSTRIHCHFDVKPVIKENGQYRNAFQDNGYFGCVPFEQYIIRDKDGKFKSSLEIKTGLQMLAEDIERLGRAIANYLRRIKK